MKEAPRAVQEIYDGGRDGRGSRVLFCYSVHRNVAGFFLGWRQVQRKKTVKRDMWLSKRKKRLVIEISRRRSEKFRARNVAAKVQLQATLK